MWLTNLPLIASYIVIIKTSCLQICMLDLVLTVLPEDSKESQTARILLYKLFYDQTDQGLTQFLLNLLKSFDTHKQAKRFSPHPFMICPIPIFIVLFYTSSVASNLVSKSFRFQFSIDNEDSHQNLRNFFQHLMLLITFKSFHIWFKLQRADSSSDVTPIY